MSSGHTNRGRNNNTVNGNKASRSRRASPNQRNPQSQSVGQHRAQIAPVPAPIRISEISAVVEQDGFVYDQPDPQAGSYINPIAAALPVADEGGSDETPPSKLPAERGPMVNSIRAPFAPGQGHLRSASNLRSPIPAPRTPGSLGSDVPAWQASAVQPAGESAADFWRSHEHSEEELPGDAGQASHPSNPPYHVDRAATWGPHEPGGGGNEPTAPVENRDVRGDIGQLIDSLHALFERDRGIASQSDTTRCGICYLHFHAAELHYREEEGFYVCPSCARALAQSRLMMVRRQQHM
jgi:hypothetical protein